MKKLTFTFITLLLCAALNSMAQFEESFNAATIPTSWQVVGYSANEFSGGFWNLTTPATVNSTGYIQYNPGTFSTINTSSYKYVIINLKNGTPQTTARFYYRYNNGWVYVPLYIDANSDYKDYIIDLSTADAYSGNVDLVGKKWAYNSLDAGTYQNMPIIRFDIPSRVLTTGGIDAGSVSKPISVDYVKFVATLPVSLTTFKVKEQSNDVQLTWSTASEKNNSHFNVLRSEDGKNFELISSITGNGNSSEVHNYSFTDLNPLSGVSYYQLDQIDFNGNSEKSEIRSVNYGIKNSEFKILTDADNGIKVSVFSVSDAPGKLMITDVSGRKSSEATYPLSKGQNLLDISSAGLTAGIYVATFEGNGEITSAKFLVH